MKIEPSKIFEGFKNDLFPPKGAKEIDRRGFSRKVVYM